MAISFDRFIALTAALATASSAIAGCDSDDDDLPATSGGSSGNSGGSGGKGGRAGGSAGGASGTGGSAASAGRHNDGGTGARGGSMGISGQGGETLLGGSGGEPATSGTAGSAGQSGAGQAGAGETGAGMGGASAGAGTEAGAGAGGAPELPCFGDEGVSDCNALPAGSLPSDECTSGPNMTILSCFNAEPFVRPGVLEGLGACLVPIPDACSDAAAAATLACENEAIERACPTTQAHDACQNGIDLGGGTTLASPLVACNDGTLTLTSCTQALSSLFSSELFNSVTCSDPANEFFPGFTGTCAELLHRCIFRHDPTY